MATRADQFAVINHDPATELEKRQTQHLKQFLEAEKLYETAEEASLREEVLGRLDQVVKAWVKLVAKAIGMAESSAKEANAKIFTFGSYRLGVHAPGADIDVLCVGPAYAKRDAHFFGQESWCLERVLQETPGVTEVQGVPRAYVPVLKIKFKGLELDVLYASLAQFLIPETLDLSPNSVLRGCDEQTVRSLNGCRVTDTILKSVPDPETFRLSLKAVKLWAERRGVYSNVAGYLGGVNMALLVAKVCRWYPRKDASAVLLSLFMFFSGTWQWPAPLHLIPQKNDDMMGLPVWDPTSDRDKRALMPIITPAFPAMNSTYNVTRCTMAVMLQEFQRGFQVCRDILVLHASPQATQWTKLFSPYKFFETKTAFYICIEIYAHNDVDLEKWDGWVRSRVRRLVQKLEEHTNVRPHPDSLRPPQGLYPGDPKPRKYYFLALSKRAAEPKPVPNPTTGMVSTQPYALQRNAGATNAAGATPKAINVTEPIKLFRQEVMEWEDRKDGMNLIPDVKKQKDLPAWVFPEGCNPLLTAGAAAAPAAAATPELPTAGDGVKVEPDSSAGGAGSSQVDNQPASEAAMTSAGDQKVEQEQEGAAKQGVKRPRQPSPDETAGGKEAKILAGGQGDMADWLGDTALQLGTEKQQQQQEQSAVGDGGCGGGGGSEGYGVGGVQAGSDVKPGEGCDVPGKVEVNGAVKTEVKVETAVKQEETAAVTKSEEDGVKSEAEGVKLEAEPDASKLVAGAAVAQQAVKRPAPPGPRTQPPAKRPALTFKLAQPPPSQPSSY